MKEKNVDLSMICEKRVGGILLVIIWDKSRIINGSGRVGYSYRADLCYLFNIPTIKWC